MYFDHAAGWMLGLQVVKLNVFVLWDYESLLHQLLSLQQAPSLLACHSVGLLGARSEHPVGQLLITSLPRRYHIG
jgi:hypothetical protein